MIELVKGKLVGLKYPLLSASRAKELCENRGDPDYEDGESEEEQESDSDDDK